MIEKGRKLKNLLHILIVSVVILAGIFTGSSWAQIPNLVFWNPGDDALNVLINTNIVLRFDMEMNPSSYSFELWDNEADQEVLGTVLWTQSFVPNDTLTFTPTNALKYGRSYSYGGFAWSMTGSGAWFDKNFITKPSSADTTPPAVQTTFPYNGMTGVWTGQSIYIKFTEVMDPSTITAPGNITLTGPCMGGMSDYSVIYYLQDVEAEIRKNSPFSASSTCTVTITTNVRDLRRNPLTNQVQFSFTTGAADGVRPTVTQTIPAGGDTNVSLFPNLYVFFSEEMDETTLTTANITLRNDSLGGTNVPIYIYWVGEDYVSFGPQSALNYNSNYTATISTGVRDRAGNNNLLNPYPWSFTTANSGVDSDPTLNWGVGTDDHVGQRWGVNDTRLLFELGAWDQVTSALTVTATPSGYAARTLTNSPPNTDYSYYSSGDEGLPTGTHLVTFTIQDGASNTVTFQRNIYIFSTTPTLSLPANGATGVSTTPTFEWSYSNGDRPLYYSVAVFDGPDPNSSPMVWAGVRVDTGSGTQSITIPAEKKLIPNKTYYWGVRGGTRDENGETYGGLWPFTTTGTLPPEPYFSWVRVRSDDPPSGPPVWHLLTKVMGPSPADIAELRVDGPSGFQYIFTEDDIEQSEQVGLLYLANLPTALLNGTYNFTVTDSIGRTATASKTFASASLPRVSSGSMSPPDSSYLGTTTPVLSWGSAAPGAYYRVRVSDWSDRENSVYLSPFTQETQVRVPSGYLLQNTPYKWRVDVYDTPYGNNRARSDMLRFSTGSASYVPSNMINSSIVWSDNDHYWGQRKQYSMNVIGPLPNHVSLANITGPSPCTFQESNIGLNLGSQGIMYNWSEPGYPTDGSYTFNVQDTFGGSDTANKSQTSATIGIVSQSSMVPANNAYLTELAPTFSWTGVSGSPRYYRITINSWRGNYTIYQSARTLNQISLTIPTGILKAGQSYKWRVEVFESANGSQADLRSTSGWNSFTAPRPSLVDHYYTSILKRTPDPGGKVYWEDETSRAEILGIDIKEAYLVMSGNFFNSGEYYGFGRTNEEFLSDLYLTFFDRAPDPGGQSYWLGELSAGATRDMVMYFFMFSPEFFDYMSERFGDTTTRAEIYPVVDFYRGFMNRLPDDGGFMYWLNRFKTAQCTGASAITAETNAISSLFLGSPEYIGRARTNSQYVQDLYYAFMRRYATAAEVAYWVGELNSGARTREFLRLFFLGSAEFQTRVNAMIAQGCDIQ